MQKKGLLKKCLTGGLLALAIMTSTVGLTSFKVNAEEKAYEPYAVSVDGNGELSVKGLRIRSYGMNDDTMTKTFPETYIKNGGVGYYLRNQYKVEPIYAGSAYSSFSDPQLVIGGLKAKVVEGDWSNLRKIHIEGYYELNLTNNWITYEPKPSDPGYSSGSASAGYDDLKTEEEKKKEKEQQELIPPSGIDGTWSIGGPEINYWYQPKTFYIQLSINGKDLKVPLNLNLNSMVTDKNAILYYPTEIFSGTFSQDILIPNDSSWNKGQKLSNGEQMKVEDIKSVAINWVLSRNTQCLAALPLDGTEVDLSKHYIDDIGIVDATTSGDNTNYKLAFITNIKNDSQAGYYSFNVCYGNNNKINKTIYLGKGDNKKNYIDVTLPKDTKNLYISNLVRADGKVRIEDERNYTVKDFRVILQKTTKNDKVSITNGDQGMVAVELQRQYIISDDLMRGVFNATYPNDEYKATSQMKEAKFTAVFEYEIKNKTTGVREKIKKEIPVILSEKSGNMELYAEFPRDVLKIYFVGLISPSTYDFNWNCGKTLYKATDLLGTPTEFTADIAGETINPTVPGHNYRDVKFRVDYGSPNTHKYAIVLKYEDNGVEKTVSDSKLTFTAKTGYYFYSVGYFETNPDNSSIPPIDTKIPGSAKYVKIERIYDTEDSSVSIPVNQYIYCEHSYDNACDYDCNWCGDIRTVQDCQKKKITVKTENCTDFGQYYYECTICGKHYNDPTYVNPLGHAYVEIIDKAATDSEAGSKHYKCTRCGDETEAEVIPALGSEEQINTPTSGNGTTDINPNGEGENEPDSDNDGIGNDGTYLGEGASQVAADGVITASKSEEDPAGTVFAKLQLVSKKVTKKSVKLSWKKISGSEYVVYGAKCGEKYKKLATITKNNYTVKGLKKAKYYRYMVVAVKNGKVVSSSKSIHVATKGGKIGNYKKVKLKKNKITVKVNNTAKIKAKQVVENGNPTVKKHRALKYESSNTAVVTVSEKGKITGVSKGTAYIYVYSQNGVFSKVKVTVKQ